MHNTIIKKDHQLIHETHTKSHCFPIFEPGCINKFECESAGEFKRIFINANNYNGNDVKESITCDEEYIKSLEKAAYQKGYEDGNLEGMVAGKKTIGPLFKKLQQTISEIEEAKAGLYKAAEKEAVELSIAIAKKIIGNEVSVNKHVVVNTVKEALKKVDGHGKIKVKINPGELDIVKENFKDNPNGTNSLDKIIFEPDETLNFGGCIVETNIGDIDARIEKQIEVIEEILGSKKSTNRRQ